VFISGGALSVGNTRKICWHFWQSGRCDWFARRGR